MWLVPRIIVNWTTPLPLSTEPSLGFWGCFLGGGGLTATVRTDFVQVNVLVPPLHMHVCHSVLYNFSLYGYLLRFEMCFINDWCLSKLLNNRRSTWPLSSQMSHINLGDLIYRSGYIGFTMIYGPIDRVVNFAVIRWLHGDTVTPGGSL